MNIMHIALTNAYSTANSGDGLLVELSRQLINEAIPFKSEIDLIAADPKSFESACVAFGAPAAIGYSTRQRISESMAALADRPPARVGRILRDAKLAVAVGGGYLRFGSGSEAFKASVVHLAQMRAASRLGTPFVLLPQSIGPLGRSRKRVLSTLSQARRVYVRDDRSFNELASLTNVIRAPDLGVLEVAHRWNSINPVGSDGAVGLAARPLGRPRNYQRNLTAVVGQLEPIPLLQSSAGSGNNDRSFMAQFGIGREPLTLQEGVLSGALGSIVSVRLHGAVQSILAGVPSIHLSYERKGFAAFADLGLAEYVHNARDFDPMLVVSQARQLTLDATNYFDRIQDRVSTLERARASIVDYLSVEVGAAAL